MAALRQQLGPQAFTAAWQEGQGMSPAHFLASQVLHEPVASQTPTPREVETSHLTVREDVRRHRFIPHQPSAHLAARAFYLRELAFVEECWVHTSILAPSHKP